MKKILLVLVAVLLVSIFACNLFVDLPTSVVLTKEVALFKVGQSVSKEQFIDEVIKNREYIEFSNCNLDKCTIDITSEIETASVGKKRIEFTVSNKRKSFTNLYIYIYVYDGEKQVVDVPSVVPLSTISFASNIVKCNSSSYTINPILEPANSNQVDFIFNVTDGEDVASVDSYGVVTKKKVGTVTVKVTSYYNPEIFKTLSIEFHDGVDIVSATFNEPKLVSDSLSIDLNSLLVLSPLDTYQKDFTFTSSNPSVATIQNGVVKRLKYGTTTITATNSENPSVSATINIEFTLAPSSYNLSDLPVSALNKEYSRVYALDFNSASMPEGVTMTAGTVSDGVWIRSNGENSHLIIDKSKIGNFTLIAFVVKDHQDPNIWCRGQLNEDNCGTPLCVLRNANWGPGWNGSKATGFVKGQEFRELLFLYNEGSVYCISDGKYLSSDSECNEWWNGITSYNNFTFRMQSGTSTLDYLAFYR